MNGTSGTEKEGIAWDMEWMRKTMAGNRRTMISNTVDFAVGVMKTVMNVLMRRHRMSYCEAPLSNNV
jgi:hypothetical protein